jgi:hypothetical protein
MLGSLCMLAMPMSGDLMSGDLMSDLMGGHLMGRPPDLRDQMRVAPP